MPTLYRGSAVPKGSISADFSAVKKHTDEQTLCLCATFEIMLAVMEKEQALR